MRNYIPFVTREVLRVGANSTAELSVARAQLANRQDNSYIIYQDCLVESDGHGDLFVRYGYEDRGYLLEQALPLNKVYNNFGGAGFTGWRFVRPYRLDPGKSMIVTFEIDAQEMEKISVVLHCRRIDNGGPHYLYGSNLDSALTIGSFSGSRMSCPDDTALYVEGISAGGYNLELNYDDYIAAGIQLYDGDGNEVVKVASNGSASFTPLQMYRNWISWWSSGIELGEENGWRLPSSQPFLLELENQNNVVGEALVTLRGSLEVY